MYKFAQGVEYDIEMENGRKYSHCTVDCLASSNDGFITISLVRQDDDMIEQYDICYDKIMAITESRKYVYFWLETTTEDHIYKTLKFNHFSPRELKLNGITVYQDKNAAINNMLKELSTNPNIEKYVLNDRTDISSCICRLAEDGTWVGSRAIQLVELVNKQQAKKLVAQQTEQ